MRFSKLIAALLITSTLPATNVASLGSVGPTYPVGEENTLGMIMKRLHEKERSGELERLQEEAIRRSMGNIRNVRPVDDITTVHARVRHFIYFSYTPPSPRDS